MSNRDDTWDDYSIKHDIETGAYLLTMRGVVDPKEAESSTLCEVSKSALGQTENTP